MTCVVSGKNQVRQMEAEAKHDLEVAFNEKEWRFGSFWAIGKDLQLWESPAQNSNGKKLFSPSSSASMSAES